MNQNQKKMTSPNMLGGYGEKHQEELREHRIWLEQNLKRAEELRLNAEKSLDFMIKNFVYLFEEKRKLISEIEHQDDEIKRLKKILCI